MRKIWLRAAYVVALLFSLMCIARAQATRTWVSGVGDDVNPCSRTAPCKTFAGAISKTATNGEINCLDSGGFGAVTIIKSITIDCKGMTGGILGALTNGIIINGADAVVRLRGVNINGAGNGLSGIKISAATKVYVEDLVIEGFTQAGIWTENSGDIKIVVSNVTIRNNASDGVYSSPKGTADIFMANSLIAGNGNGIRAGANATFRISGNSITANTVGLSSSGGKIISFKNNSIDGNGTNGAPTSTVSQQ